MCIEKTENFKLLISTSGKRVNSRSKGTIISRQNNKFVFSIRKKEQLLRENRLWLNFTQPRFLDRSTSFFRGRSLQKYVENKLRTARTSVSPQENVPWPQTERDISTKWTVFFSHALAVIALLETCFTTVDFLFENPPFTVGNAKTGKLLSGIRQGLRERYTTI